MAPSWGILVRGPGVYDRCEDAYPQHDKLALMRSPVLSQQHGPHHQGSLETTYMKRPFALLFEGG